ncbi:MAG: two-component sensor histidine kinase [Rhizobiaceae bacterium]|nr:two-component sensor histidine kinase [Rhizobiaceae bacterium]MCV0405897.1 two-component sensor histidine kinase [Rhizobiaceae bacterium]
MSQASDTASARDTRKLPSKVAARLAAAGWLIGAAFIALAVVAVAGGAPTWAVLVGSTLILAAAVLRPEAGASRGVGGEDSAKAPGLDGLTAEDLGAAVSDPLFVFDGEGAVLFANPPAVDAFGKTALLTPIEMKFRAPEMQELLRRSLAGEGGPISIDYAERVPLERWYRVTAAPIDNAGSTFALFFRDQSELRRIDRMRADFIANASHELRTPLASVAGFIETLRGPARDDPDAREQFLQIMQAQTSRMARLIDDLLSLSRLEMKAYLKPGEIVDLVDVVRSVGDALDHLARESGVALEWELPAGPVEIDGNRDELIQVFENLLENACKYGASGGRVILRLERQERKGVEEIDVTVQDFGPGIPGEHIPRVTERFYRVDVETSRAQKGTGLGLAIVKHILTRHNARLTIRSEEGKGATFTVHFPAPRSTSSPRDDKPSS